MKSRLIVLILVLLAGGLASYTLLGGEDGRETWFIDLGEGERLLGEPVPYNVEGKSIYLVVTSSRVIVIDALDGSIISEASLEGVNAGLGYRPDPPEVYVGKSNGDSLDIYKIYLDGMEPRLEGPVLGSVSIRSSFSERGLWTASNNSLMFYPFPSLEPVIVESPLQFSDPISVSAHSVGPFDAISLILKNASSFTLVVDMREDPKPVAVLRNYVVADTITSERGVFLAVVSYSGDNIAEYSIEYIVDVVQLGEDGKPRTFYSLSHRNAVNYPPAIEFYTDPLYIAFLSVGPKSRTGNFSGTDPAVVIVERDGDTIAIQYLADLVGGLPPKTLWTPYTGLANPIDLDGDGLVDVLASVRMYEGEVWRIRLVHLEMPIPGG
ncbi:MAG: hypothetical protein F7B18_08205 [Desulfurococcales archaeon]|nr:hypothetical protein [Desulfurococcales archaeon]